METEFMALNRILDKLKKFNVKIPDGPQLTDEERRRAEEELL